ncbi:MAG: gliding motility-associated C-terminal domain-containing protein [Marinilabiliaceae bacterium]|nr:gliding motility-associated C-terminal domain-containing protein [Marinilabiliaceae bacterium]
MKTATLLILFSLLSYLPSLAQGKITAPGAIPGDKMTDYPNNYPDDPIYYFENINNAQLSMLPMGGVSYTFQWYKYNTTTEEFDLLLKTESGSTSSLFITEANGYRVLVDDGMSTPENYYCWTFQPDNSKLEIIIGNSDQCYTLKQEVSNGLIYYNHKGTNGPIMADHEAVYTWSSIPTPEEKEDAIDGKTDRTTSITAPLADTEYTVSVTNSVFGDYSLTNDYTAIAVNPEYEWEIDDPSDNEGQKEGSSGSAPMTVRFKPKYTKGENDYYDWYYEWDFKDGGSDFVPDPVYVFRKNGNYAVTNIVSHPTSGCKDSVRYDVATVFKLNDFEVLIPDAFTPFSSPGNNDEFRVHYNSVKTFSMIIYNRWGRKVFQTSRPDEGWDGRIGGRKAEPGVYFYQVDATGYNGETPISKSGPVHLIIMNH